MAKLKVKFVDGGGKCMEVLVLGGIREVQGSIGVGM